MKKLILTTSMVLSTLLASSQIFEEETCVTCRRNTIDLLKYSSAVGTNNTSTGERSFAGGINSQATGNYSFAFGENVKATQRSSWAGGFLSEANGVFSIAMGYQAKTSHHSAMAFGFIVEANLPSDFAVGRFLKAHAGNAIVIGGGYNIEQPLINTIPGSMMIGFKSNVPTFFVGESSGVDSTGKIGIGNVTDPDAKLHIKADDNEHATLRLEPTGSGKVAKIEFGGNADDYFLSVNPTGHMSFRVPDEKNFVFENGKIVATAIQISQGAVAGHVLKSDASGNAVWDAPAWAKTPYNNIIHPFGNVGIGIIPEPSERLHVDGFARTSGGYKVGGNIVINSNRDYNGRNGSFSGNLTVTGSGNSSFSGKVGIGTTNPTAKLEIAGQIKITGGEVGEGKVLTSDASGLASWSALSADNITSGTLPVAIGGTGLSSVTSGRILFGSDNALSTSDNLHWENSNGRLGIGTTSPGSTLQVNGNVAIGNTSTSAPVNGLAVLGNVRIGTATILQIHENAAMFSGVTPKLHVRPSSNPGEYEEMVLLQQSYNSTPALRRLGYIMKLGGGNANEINKMGGLVLDSESDWGNHPRLHLVTANQKRLTVTNDGKIGINTSTPEEHLHVNGNTQIDGNLYVANSNILVSGEIHAEKFRAALNISWPDYVFDPSYNLPHLSDIEQFVVANRHLPGMPSAQIVEKEGFELAEMNALLLKKIEELTLYVIEQQKQINALNQRFAETE